jgi:hypothetical protein
VGAEGHGLPLVRVKPNVGLNFIHAASSAQINGVGRDAAYVAKAIAARVRGGAPAELHRPAATPAHS